MAIHTYQILVTLVWYVHYFGYKSVPEFDNGLHTSEHDLSADDMFDWTLFTTNGYRTLLNLYFVQPVIPLLLMNTLLPV